ncbi:MAG TPA: serine hydrolase [Chitinophagales bacterium]|nr:serine hydrolase [Chitinophagales bacterium]
MKNLLNKVFAIAITSSLFSITIHAQITTALDDYILDKMKNARLPGVAVAIIKDGKAALTKGYGLANVDKDIPYTPNTIQQIASISKPVTATAVMKLWEDGLFELDDPINNYLPFPVTNPFYPGVPITFRMLLSHTSSLILNDVSANNPLFSAIVHVAPGTAEELGPFLQSVFVPGGSRYVDSISYNHFAPGSQYVYSNFGYALLAYLVEQISGMPFNEYCNQNIFQPLCMNNTAWYYSELDTNLVARPYQLHGNQLVDYNLYECPDYPGRQLKSTAIDLSKFILMHLNYGILDGARIIDSTTEVMMRTTQIVAIPNGSLMHDNQIVNLQVGECLGWQHLTLQYGNNSKEFFGHEGNDIGIRTEGWINVGNNTIVTVLSNPDNTFSAQFALEDIHIELDATTDTISTAGAPSLNCSYTFNPCEHSTAHWKNNTTAWPIGSVPMKIGTKHYYTQQQVLDVLNNASTTDASIVLAKALIGAKLNVAQGSELAPIVLTINSAMDLIGSKRLPYKNPISFSSSTGIQMLALAATLNSYNSGAMNTTACSGSSDRESADADIPLEYSMASFPNPFSNVTSISFSLPQTENISVKIFDVNGRLLRTLVDGESIAGTHQLEWNASDVEAGIYFLRMETATHSENRKLIVVK